jgi:DNA-binding IclR family transcriptional regulator
VTSLDWEILLFILRRGATKPPGLSALAKGVSKPRAMVRQRMRIMKHTGLVQGRGRSNTLSPVWKLTAKGTILARKRRDRDDQEQAGDQGVS